MPPTWLSPAEQVPPAPAGPGVRAPFAAPPSERDRKRLWISLVLGGVLLLLCCGGGIAGFSALVVATEKSLPVEATSVVTRYLEGLRSENYQQAYDQLCGAHQQGESLQEFAAHQRLSPRPTEWALGDPRLGQNEVFVPAHIYLSGDNLPHDRDFILVQDQQAGGLRICGGE
jgi:hypothetical protein